MDTIIIEDDSDEAVDELLGDDLSSSRISLAQSNGEFQLSGFQTLDISAVDNEKFSTLTQAQQCVIDHVVAGKSVLVVGAPGRPPIFAHHHLFSFKIWCSHSCQSMSTKASFSLVQSIVAIARAINCS